MKLTPSEPVIPAKNKPVTVSLPSYSKFAPIPESNVKNGCPPALPILPEPPINWLSFKNNPPMLPSFASIEPEKVAFVPSIKNFCDANCPVFRLNSVPAAVNPLPLPVEWFWDLRIPVDTTPPSILVVLAPPIWDCTSAASTIDELFVPSVILFAEVNVTKPVNPIACTGEVKDGEPVFEPPLDSFTLNRENQYLFELPAVKVGALNPQFEVRDVKVCAEKLYAVALGVPGLLADDSW